MGEPCSVHCIHPCVSINKNPVDVNSSIPAVGRLRGLASLNCTIWAGDSDCIASKAVVGTNFGATLVDVETGVSSTLCRSKSDVLSVQLNPLVI